jgi:hypothetical protein
MTQNCGDPNCKNCNPVKPIVKRTMVLNSLGEEIGFAEPPIPDGQGGFLEQVMLTDSWEENRLRYNKSISTVEELIEAVGIVDDKASKGVTIAPKRLRITNRREVVTYGLRNRYNPCSVCGKPTRSISDSRGPLCNKCSKGK